MHTDSFLPPRAPRTGVLLDCRRLACRVRSLAVLDCRRLACRVWGLAVLDCRRLACRAGNLLTFVRLTPLFQGLFLSSPRPAALLDARRIQSSSAHPLQSLGLGGVGLQASRLQSREPAHFCEAYSPFFRACSSVLQGLWPCWTRDASNPVVRIPCRVRGLAVLDCRRLACRAGNLLSFVRLTPLFSGLVPQFSKACGLVGRETHPIQ